MHELNSCFEGDNSRMDSNVRVIRAALNERRVPRVGPMDLEIKPSFQRTGDEDHNFYVDIPTEECIGNPKGAFKNVAVLNSRAIRFAREHFGADEEGRISLVSG